MQKNILITGGAGFIGYNLYKKIKKKKINIYILDFKEKIKKKKFGKNCHFILGNISNKKIFSQIIKKKIFFDEIFHFAAETSTFLCEKYPKKCFKTNIKGTLNLYNYCKILAPKKLIFASSMAVYGKNAYGVKETNKCNPISNYGLSKLNGEKILKKLKTQNVNVKIFRIFNAYGPYQDYNNPYQGMLSIYLSQIIRKSYVEVTGSLNRARDFIYINDILNAITNQKVINYKKTDLFNLGSGKKVKVSNLINKIFKITKKKKKIIIKSKHSGDSNIAYANIDLLKKLGWKNTFALDKGIKNMINDINKFDENSGNFNW